MGCGDAGHILCLQTRCRRLRRIRDWRPFLHDLGACEVKHGVRVGVVSLYEIGVGNPQLPKKFQALKKHRTRVRWVRAALALLALAAIVAGIAIFSRHRAGTSLAAPEKSIAVLPFENLSEEKRTLISLMA